MNQQPLSTKTHPLQPSPSFSSKPFSWVPIIPGIIILILAASFCLLLFRNLQLSRKLIDIKNCAAAGGKFIEATGRAPSCNIGPQPTPSFYTYTNTMYHFTFQYPSFQHAADNTSESLSSSRHHMVISDDTGKQALLSLIMTKESPMNIASEIMTVKKQESLVVANFSIIKLTGAVSEIGSVNQTLYYFSKNGNYFIFPNPDESLFLQILSTFKFIQ
jgi:hypothetical protein